MGHLGWAEEKSTQLALSVPLVTGPHSMLTDREPRLPFPFHSPQALMATPRGVSWTTLA